MGILVCVTVSSIGWIDKWTKKYFFFLIISRLVTTETGMANMQSIQKHCLLPICICDGLVAS